MRTSIKILISAAAFGLLVMGILDRARSAEPREKTLEFLRLELPDGTGWTLGEGAIGRPFMARLVLANVGDRPIRIWDNHTSEGSSCPRIVLANEQGREVVLRPPTIPRLAGVAVARTLGPAEVFVIELELLRLVDEESPPPPGKYRIAAEYIASPDQDPAFKDLWNGTIRSQTLEMNIKLPPAPKRP